MTTAELQPTGLSIGGKARASVVEAWAKMKPLVISAGVASMVLTAILLPIKEFDLGGTHASAGANFVFGLVQAIFQAAIGAPLAVAMHRLILKNEVTSGFIAFRHSYHWLFFLWLVALEIVSSVLVSGTLLTKSSVLMLVVAIGLFVLAVKSAMIFPAIAIEAPISGWLERLRISWRQMQGNFWLFVRAGFLAALPILFLLLLIIGAEVLILLALEPLGPIAMVPIGAVAIIAMIGVIQPLGIMLAAAVASWLYLWMQNRPADQAQSAQTATSTVT